MTAFFASLRHSSLWRAKISLLLLLFSNATASRSALTNASGIDIPVFNSVDACQGSPLILKDAFGYITQPEFDITGLYPYPDDLNCTWNLIAEAGKVIFVSTTILDMEADCAGYVSLRDGESGEEMRKYCGRAEIPLNFRSPRSSLNIYFVGRRFRPEHYPQTRGVKLYFEHTSPPAVCSVGEKKCRHKKRCFSAQETCDGHDNCGDGTDEQGCPPTRGQREFQQDCGTPAIAPYHSHHLARRRKRIAGGSPAIPHSWPWQVDMRNIYSEPDGHLAAAVIIDSQWLLTVAHSFDGRPPKTWLLHFAKHNKLVRDEKEIVRYIDKVFVHPGYELGDEDNDIALIRLNAHLPDNMTEISAACLPPIDYGGPDPGEMTMVTGWGQTQMGHALVLNQVEVPVITKEECDQWVAPFNATERMLCAGYLSGGRDACHGDSGGPMTMLRDNRWILVGIISSGSGGCGRFAPEAGSYSKVSAFMPWIVEIMKKES